LIRLGWFLIRRGRDFDAVHVHIANVQADVVGAAARLVHLPYYVKVACGGSVGEVQRLAPIAWATRWYGLRNADRVQALSEEIREELQSIGVPTERIVTIPNGIDGEAFRPSSVEEKIAIRRRLDLPVDRVLVLFVGRFARYKGVGDLVAAWEKVIAPNAHLLLVGAPADDDPVEVPTAMKNVSIRPWALSPVDYFRAADIFVHPSHADGMSNAVLEAMACGLAIVATDHRAGTALLSPDEAMLVPVASPPALSASITELIEDRALAGRLAANAVEASQRLDIDRVVDRIEDVYREVLSC